MNRSRDDHGIDVNRLLRKAKRKLCFCVEKVSDLHAARGLISALRIQLDRCAIVFSDEADEVITRRLFPTGTLRKGVPPRRNRLLIRFDADGKPRIRNGELILNHDPYKYFLSRSSSPNSRIALRGAMRIAGSRKVIVSSNSTRGEIAEVLKSYRRLRLAQRPLLILGVRQPVRSLKGLLFRMGLKAAWRTRREQSLSSFGRMDVVVLNTRGELLDFLKAADLAIVGHDRNLFEPAVLGVPILYFGGPLAMKPKVRKIVALFNLSWRKNRTAQRLLETTGGARKIIPAALAEQMTRVLANPDEITGRAREAVRKLDREVLPAARRRAAHLLAAALGESKDIR